MKGKTQEKLERRSKKCWEWEDGESWWQIGKTGRTLFDSPQPTVGCSANGRRRNNNFVGDFSYKACVRYDLQMYHSLVNTKRDEVLTFYDAEFY